MEYVLTKDYGPAETSACNTCGGPTHRGQWREDGEKVIRDFCPRCYKERQAERKEAAKEAAKGE